MDKLSTDIVFRSKDDSFRSRDDAVSDIVGRSGKE